MFGSTHLEPKMLKRVQVYSRRRTRKGKRDEVLCIIYTSVFAEAEHRSLFPSKRRAGPSLLAHCASFIPLFSHREWRTFFLSNSRYCPLMTPLYVPQHHELRIYSEDYTHRLRFDVNFITQYFKFNPMACMFCAFYML